MLRRLEGVMAQMELQENSIDEAELILFHPKKNDKVLLYICPIIHRSFDRFFAGRCWTGGRQEQLQGAKICVGQGEGCLRRREMAFGNIGHQVEELYPKLAQVCLEIWPIVLKQFRDLRPGSDGKLSKLWLESSCRKDDLLRARSPMVGVNSWRAAKTCHPDFIHFHHPIQCPNKQQKCIRYGLDVNSM